MTSSNKKKCDVCGESGNHHGSICVGPVKEQIIFRTNGKDRTPEIEALLKEQKCACDGKLKHCEGTLTHSKDDCTCKVTEQKCDGKCAPDECVCPQDTEEKCEYCLGTHYMRLRGKSVPCVWCEKPARDSAELPDQSAVSKPTTGDTTTQPDHFSQAPKMMPTEQEEYENYKERLKKQLFYTKTDFCIGCGISVEALESLAFSRFQEGLTKGTTIKNDKLLEEVETAFETGKEAGKREGIELIRKEWLSLDLRHTQPENEINKELTRFSLFIQSLSKLYIEK